MNIGAFMDALVSTGYRGPLSHEIFNDIFRRSDPSQTALDGYRSLQYLLSMLPQQKASVLMSLGRKRFSWGSEKLVDAGVTRATYLHALQVADKHDFQPIFELVCS